MFNIFAGAVIAVLVGLGVGSGGLFILYLTLVTGEGQLTAQGMNLLFFLLASVGALIIYLRRRKLRLPVLLLLSLTGAVGAALGALAAGVMEPTLLKKLFGALMLFSGVIMLRRG